MRHGTGIACACVLLLAACGGSGGDTSDASRVEGKYFHQMAGPAGQGMSMELRENGLAVATGPGTTVKQGSYGVKGDKVTVLLEGRVGSIDYTVRDDGNLATTFYGNEEAVFVKQ